MIFSLLSVLLAMFGVVILLSRKTFLGWLVGQQLIIQAVICFGVIVGNSRGQPLEGQAASFFVILLGILFLVSGLALATRRFYLKKTNLLSKTMDEGSISHE